MIQCLGEGSVSGVTVLDVVLVEGVIMVTKKDAM